MTVVHLTFDWPRYAFSTLLSFSSLSLIFSSVGAWESISSWFLKRKPLFLVWSIINPLPWYITICPLNLQIKRGCSHCIQRHGDKSRHWHQVGPSCGYSICNWSLRWRVPGTAANALIKLSVSLFWGPGMWCVDVTDHYDKARALLGVHSQILCPKSENTLEIEYFPWEIIALKNPSNLQGNRLTQRRIERISTRSLLSQSQGQRLARIQNRQPHKLKAAWQGPRNWVTTCQKICHRTWD